MLFLGNNVNSATNNVSLQSYDYEKVQQIEESVSLFDEQIQITRQSIHYSQLCSELALEEETSSINYYTGTVQKGVEFLSNMGVSQENANFLQDSINSLATSFQQAVLTAKERVQERAARAENVQNQRNNNAPAAEPQQVETVRTLDRAIDNIETPDFDNNQNTEIITEPQETETTTVTELAVDLDTDISTDTDMLDTPAVEVEAEAEEAKADL